MKILSPAGNLECLKSAVASGADEVYLGINDFNARNNIDGFNMENLRQAVSYAHVMGVKVLLAINILFSDQEMQSALDTIVQAYNMGVDAFIIQDLGLISLVYKHYPQIEIHASTQMGLHNLEGVRKIAKYGVKRVVLARETPLSEIRRIKENLDIELEYFAHGALCVCFSGNCYLSSYLLGASGNRGRCKQLCRLPYEFYDGQKFIKKGYLLSAKDFNMLNRLKDLEQAGVDVLKIEGRARRPYYVSVVTSAYKNALNNLTVDMAQIELAFNRGFTQGYFNGNSQIISDVQSHIGVQVGKVEKIKNGKTFNEIFISSNVELSKKSTFKIFNGNTEKNTFTAYDLTRQPNGQYRLTTTQKVQVGDSVRLIVDAQKESQIANHINKRNITVNIDFAQNQPAKASVEIEGDVVEILGEQCLPAVNSPITLSELESNFSKNELFSAKIMIKRLEPVFIPKQKLNQFRRQVFEAVFDFIVNKHSRALGTVKIDKQNPQEQFSDYCVIERLSEFNRACKNVIYSPGQYKIEDILKVKSECENQGKAFYLDTPNFALEKDIIILKDIIEKTGVKIVANNYYALSFNTEKIIGYGLNVYNNFTATEHRLKYLSAEGQDGACKPPFMTLRHCPIKSHVGGNCQDCKFKSSYFYKMDNGRKLRLTRKKLSSCTFYLCE